MKKYIVTCNYCGIVFLVKSKKKPSIYSCPNCIGKMNVFPYKREDIEKR